MADLTLIASLIFVLTYLLIITELVDKVLAVLVGVGLMVVFGIINFSEVPGLIDFQSVMIVMGIGIIVNVAMETGLFDYIGIKTIKLARGNQNLLFILLGLVVTFFSSFMTDASAILIVGSLTIVVARLLDVSAIPFLLCEIFMANIGGNLFLISGVTNIIIASAAGISFSEFFLSIGVPVIFVGALSLGVLLFLLRNDLEKPSSDKLLLDEESFIKDKAMMWKSLAIFGIMFSLFIFSSIVAIEAEAIIIFAAVLMLLFSGRDTHKVLEKVDWASIVFFSGLLVLVGAVAKTGVLHSIAQAILVKTGGNGFISTLVTLWGSGLVSNVTANIAVAAAFIPIVQTLVSAGIQTMSPWRALIIGACLGGNVTPIGSMDNILMMTLAQRNGIKFPWGKFIRLGLLIVNLQLLIFSGLFWLGLM